MRCDLVLTVPALYTISHTRITFIYTSGLDSRGPSEQPDWEAHGTLTHINPAQRL